MNPVMKALTEARLKQISTKDDAMAAVVRQIIGPTPYDDSPPPAVFERWCAAKGVSALPAATSAVALFVLEHQGFGLEAVLQHLRGISAVHTNAGLADPTTSWPVTAAFNTIAKLEAPRSWPKAEKVKWLAIPYTLQAFVAKHEEQRERAVHKAHQEAADLRKQLNAQTPTQDEPREAIQTVA